MFEPLRGATVNRETELALVASLEKLDADARVDAVVHLGEAREPSIETLEALLAAAALDHPALGENAMRSLAQIGMRLPVTALDPLLAATASEHDAVARAAIHALGNLQGLNAEQQQRCAARMLELIDARPEARADACEVIGYFALARMGCLRRLLALLDEPISDATRECVFAAVANCFSADEPPDAVVEEVRRQTEHESQATKRMAERCLEAWAEPIPRRVVRRTVLPGEDPAAFARARCEARLPHLATVPTRSSGGCLALVVALAGAALVYKSSTAFMAYAFAATTLAVWLLYWRFRPKHGGKVVPEGGLLVEVDQEAKVVRYCGALPLGHAAVSLLALAKEEVSHAGIEAARADPKAEAAATDPWKAGERAFLAELQSLADARLRNDLGAVSAEPFRAQRTKPYDGRPLIRVGRNQFGLVVEPTLEVLRETFLSVGGSSLSKVLLRDALLEPDGLALAEAVLMLVTAEREAYGDDPFRWSAAVYEDLAARLPERA